MEVDVIKQSRTRTRPKKRANRELVAAKVSDSSVEKTVAPIVSTPEVAVGESTQPVVMEESSGVLIKVPAEAPAEPLKEVMEIVSPNSLSSERTRTPRSEETPYPKISKELVKELALSDEVLEQVVAQDSVVTLLKYLDRKREKYAVSKEVRLYVERVRNRTQLKRALVVKREWDSATEFARERAANLATECTAVKVTLQEREAQLWKNEIECEVLQLNMEKESGRCAELEKTCGGLCKSNENGRR
ncbi:hypothetical protein AXG93_1762s1260 [Marchantia polymorpha subsp. ruderalis]|uniref:Uncharacterized protein n=1 Tax=Marchantia polymorpha subsp. ruderalis TaxID=1480154 RepID=A0A176WBN4_MARPO|nr:hypothetical protein AXG93_1762s1260 [Marchantia polymorpha subsp. ruderalis]